MRKCTRCDTIMNEQFNLMISGKDYGLVISKGSSLFSKKISTPKIAICPNCGEISLYIDTVDIINK